MDVPTYTPMDKRLNHNGSKWCVPQPNYFFVFIWEPIG